jgi:hypothetical protein
MLLGSVVRFEAAPADRAVAMLKSRAKIAPAIIDLWIFMPTPFATLR